MHGGNSYPARMANRGVPSGRPGATERARELRSELSVPERVLWKHLRARRLAGLKFRRQHPIGPYYADFCCTEARLVVEIDGRQHGAQREHDARRDAVMEAHGLRVVRVQPREISKQLIDVLEMIARIAKERMAEERESETE